MNRKKTEDEEKVKETNFIIAEGSKGDKVEPQTRNYFNHKQEVWRSSKKKNLSETQRISKKTSFHINTTKKLFIFYKVLKKIEI